MCRYVRLRLLVALAFAFFGAAPAQAEEASDFRFFATELPDRPDEKRNYAFAPLLSLVMPGFDQWWEHQYRSAAVYTGLALGGYALADSAAYEYHRKYARDDRWNWDEDDFDELDSLERQYVYGSQLVMVAGEISAFHAFRSAVNSRKAHGQFEFLEADETTADLLLAPFQFGELLKPTTFVPLLGGALIAARIAKDDRDSMDLTFGESAYALGISYNAGVGEEAFFRGYMMPALRQGTGSDFWSNALTGLAFGAAHLSSGSDFPWFQTAGGWYFGWLTQRAGWSLRQAIFVHAWWDALVIGASFAGAGRISKPIYLPRLTLEF